MFDKLSKYFANDNNVLGFEIINEPFPGSIYTDFNLFTNSTYGDLMNLQPLYDSVGSIIRKNAPSKFIFFEPLVTNGEVLARKAGFAHPPGGKANADHSVLSAHFYCDYSVVYEYECPLAGPEYQEECAILTSPDYCYLLYASQYAVRSADAKALGVPLINTEFGSWTGNITEDVSQL